MSDDPPKGPGDVQTNRGPIGPGQDTRVISRLQGISPAVVTRLALAGVTTTDALLERGAGPEGRAELEAATGIPHAEILRLVNRADLDRISGIGPAYSDLLMAVGVASAGQLAGLAPGALAAALAAANVAQRLVRRVPTAKVVSAWVAQSQSLPEVVHVDTGPRRPR